MKPQTIIVLAAVTLAAVLLAIISANVSTVGNVIAERGQPLIGDAVALADRAKAFVVETGDGTTRVERKGKQFVDASGYSVKPDTVRKIAASLALLTIEERKTADPDRYKDLELAAPDADDGAGTRIVLEGDGGTRLLSVIAGAREYTVGGTRGGQYVRVEGQPKSYLVRGSVDVPVVRSSWFDTKLVEIKETDIVRVTAKAKDQTGYEIKREGETLTVVNLPEDKDADDAKLARIKRLVEPLSFADVRTAAKDAKLSGAVLKVEDKSGLTLTIAELAPRNPDDDQEEQWVRISASGAGEEATKRAADLANKLDSYDFRLSAGEIEVLKWTTGDLVKKPSS